MTSANTRLDFGTLLGPRPSITHALFALLVNLAHREFASHRVSYRTDFDKKTGCPILVAASSRQGWDTTMLCNTTRRSRRGIQTAASSATDHRRAHDTQPQNGNFYAHVYMDADASARTQPGTIPHSE
jgi:hypothetical protein